LTEEEFQQLEDQIKSEGCREPLILWNDILVDGHNRYIICTKNKISFKTITQDFPDRDAVKEWIIKNQFGRRNLSIYDRSVLALKLKDLYEKKSKEKQVQGGKEKVIQISGEPIRTDKELAKVAGVSHDTIHKVEVIQEKASFEQKQKLKDKESSIDKVYKEIKKEEKVKQFQDIENPTVVLEEKLPKEKTKTGTKEWSDYSLNINQGCEHNCRYCYARENAMRYGVIKNADEWTKTKRLKGFDKSVTKQNGQGMFPTTHDITPNNIDDCILFLHKHLEAGNKILITSKPHLDCIKKICKEFKDYKQQILFRFTIGSMIDDVLRFWEPEAPLFAERFESLQCAFNNGFETSVSCEPMLDQVIDLLVYKLQPYVTQTIWIGKMNKIKERLKLSSDWSQEQINYYRHVLRCNKKEFIISLDEQLYKDNELYKKIRWKESCKKDLGLPAQKDIE
jgi:DNA repair photolyase